MAITPRQKGATSARQHHAPAKARFLDRIEPFFAGKDVIGGPLLLATIAALLFTNSPLRESYERFWDTQLLFGFGRLSVSHSLAEWIDHALLPLFFIVIGTDVKRELVRGALSQLRTAIFPIAGAIGGMLVPVFLFWLVARGSEAMTGWGTVITMDTAFASAWRSSACLPRVCQMGCARCSLRLLRSTTLGGCWSSLRLIATQSILMAC